jgi:hypothetical protein
MASCQLPFEEKLKKKKKKKNELQYGLGTSLDSSSYKYLRLEILFGINYLSQIRLRGIKG